MIKKEYHRVQFFIVDSNPTSKVKNFVSDNQIKVTGFVDDIRPFYNMSDITAIPLRLARGIQNKVLEAITMEKSVTATSKAVEGIKVNPEKHCWVPDAADDLAAKVCLLQKNKLLRKQLEINSRKFIETNYNWDRNLQNFERLLKADRP